MSAKVKNKEETPLMRQFLAIKKDHPGAILLFRVGDFYETFGEDAVIASKILGIVLTKRANGKASHVELAGFPYHSLEVYLPKLVRAGHRVAICEQLEDPKKTKKIVQRGVTEIMTPGVVFSDSVLKSNENNFLAAISQDTNHYGIAFCDVSTGEFYTAEGDQEFIEKLCKALSPSEILTSKAAYQNNEYASFLEGFYTYPIDGWLIEPEFGKDILFKHFQVSSLKGFGLEKMKLAVAAAGAVLYYLNQNKHVNLSHINGISRIDKNESMWLDHFTIRNLEIVNSQQPGGKSLLDVLDSCSTPMGSRMLKNFLLMPSLDIKEINQRLNATEYFKENREFREIVRNELSLIGDLRRFAGKLAMKKINPKETWQIAKGMFQITKIIQLISDEKNSYLPIAPDFAEDYQKVSDKIKAFLKEDCPTNIAKGGIVNTGINSELDELLILLHSGKEHLIKIQQREIEQTGISSLKISFNNVFGFYLEVKNTHKDKVPENWIRKQTLANAERYITPELKEYEEKILNAEDKILELETQLYEQFIDQLQLDLSLILRGTEFVAKLDCLASFGYSADKYNYCRPLVNESLELHLKNARHPVIERLLPETEQYIPNDLLVNNEEEQLIILTGPNMSGKSALLRQSALAILMAQCGSFVAAEKSIIGLTDKIFTRVGASDNISQGESTFMVEMIETANILNNISSRSFIILDEIGRGTSTYDGISIAWSIAEFLHNHHAMPKTLFATHYHELNELEKSHTRIANYHIATHEEGKHITFLRKLKKGGSQHSFGIHVAQLAGLPKKVTERAKIILAQLEKQRTGNKSGELIANNYQLKLFNIEDPSSNKLKDLLNQLDTNSMSPIEALLKLNELKNLLS